MNTKAKKINEQLRQKVKIVTIGDMEFEIKVIDIFDMMDIGDSKMIVLNEAKTKLGLKPFQAVPKQQREEYAQLVAELSGKAYIKEINNQTIKGFIKTVLPKACIDPIVIDKPTSEIDKENEVSLELLLANLDISVSLVNEILKFSVENSILNSDLSEEIEALSNLG